MGREEGEKRGIGGVDISSHCSEMVVWKTKIVLFTDLKKITLNLEHMDHAKSKLIKKKLNLA